MANTPIPSSAKQWRLVQANGIDSLVLVDFDVPTPGVDEVLVKLAAGSLNFRDEMVARGTYPVTSSNMIPGSDGAGTVVAVGPIRYSQFVWNEGDRVAGQFTQLLQTGTMATQAEFSSTLGAGWDGIFTQYRVFPAFGLVRIPDGLSFEEASTLPCAALTAYNALYGSPSQTLRPGQWVLTLGTGGVSIFAMQLALTGGAHCIITSSSDAKLQKAKEIAGGHSSRLHLINYSKTPDWDIEVRKIVSKGVNFVIEVGGNATLPKSFNCVALGGTVVAAGSVAAVATGEFPDANRLVTLTNSNHRGLMIGSRAQFEDLNAHIEATHLKPFISKVFPFADLKEAYRYLDSQKHVGKVVVRISEGAVINRSTGKRPCDCVDSDFVY